MSLIKEIIVEIVPPVNYIPNALIQDQDYTSGPVRIGGTIYHVSNTMTDTVFEFQLEGNMWYCPDYQESGVSLSQTLYKCIEHSVAMAIDYAKGNLESADKCKTLKGD